MFEYLNQVSAFLDPSKQGGDGSDFVVLGSGTSSGTPRLECLVKPPRHHCACAKSVVGDPKNNKDYRLNPSMLFRFRSGGGTKFILVDACKTFRQSAVRWFPEHGIPHVDAVLFSHEHSDAMLGIDDLREAQQRGSVLPMYMSECTYKRVRETFGYLIDSDPDYLNGTSKGVPASKTAGRKDKTFTASIKCKIIAKPDLSEAKSPQPFDLEGVQVTSFPVYHGENNLSLGFVFGRGTSKLVYISDVYRLPEGSEKFLKSLNIEILMVDAISPDKPYRTSHQSLQQAIELGLKLGATRLLLTGLGHMVIHDQTPKEFSDRIKKAKAAMKTSNDIQVELCYDGMVVKLGEIEL